MKEYFCLNGNITNNLYFYPIIEGFDENDETENKNIWLYWENKPGRKKPDYLNLCFKSVEKNCSRNFNINLLDENSVKEYLPDLRNDLNEKLNIPQKTDYIRLKLLHLYGGIWLDSDIIILKDLSEIIKKLDTHDFVGFGCHHIECTKNGDGYPNPANWVFAAKKGSILMKNCIDECDKILDENDSNYFATNYHIIGRKLLWRQISNLQKQNWDYYHYNSYCIERDSSFNKYVNKRLISDEDHDIKCEHSLFVPIYNTAPGFPDWFLNMSETEHLNNNTLFSKLIRKALK